MVKKKVTAIPVTGRGGPEGCETSRLPHFLDNRITDSGEVVSLTRRPSALYLPRKIPGTHFCQRLSRRKIRSASGRIGFTVEIRTVYLPNISQGLRQPAWWEIGGICRHLEGPNETSLRISSFLAGN
jgi:hypothetical protein